MEPKSLCIKLQEFGFLSTFPLGRCALWGLKTAHLVKAATARVSYPGNVMNTLSFCPFHSIENNILFAQVIRL